jgi:hypothetical protein
LASLVLQSGERSFIFFFSAVLEKVSFAGNFFFIFFLHRRRALLGFLFFFLEETKDKKY